MIRLLRKSLTLALIAVPLVGCSGTLPESTSPAAKRTAPVPSPRIAAKYDAYIQGADPVGLIRALRADRSPDVLPWLEQKAKEGHPVAQFELAERLIGSDPSRAMGFYASAKLTRFLDRQLCGKPKPDLQGMIELHYAGRFAGLESKYEDAYGAGIRAATEKELARTDFPDYRWGCDEWDPSKNGLELNKAALDLRRNRAERLLIGEKGRVASKINAARPINPDKYPVITSPFLPYGGATWLDNDRLYTRRPIAEPTEQSASRPFDYIVWNVRTGEVTKIENVPDRQLCVSEGKVGYGVREGGYSVYYYGLFGREQEIDRLRMKVAGKPIQDRKQERDLYFSSITCRPYDMKKRPIDSMWMVPLLEEHGYMSHKKSGNFFVRARDKKEFVVPFDNGTYQGGFYVPHIGAYVFARDMPIMYSVDLRPAWFLRPDGRVEQATMAAGPWFSASSEVLYSRAGFVVASDALGTKGDGNGGLYVVTDKDARRISTGFPQGVGVSPDGCRIAFVAAHAIGPRTFQVFDVCNKGK